MIKITDIDGTNTVIFTNDLRYIDIKPQDNNSFYVLFKYMDSTEVTLTIDKSYELDLYDQLDNESGSISDRILLKSVLGGEYIVSLNDIRYVYYGDLDSDDSRRVVIHRVSGQHEEYNKIKSDSCDKLKLELLK